MQRSLRNGEPTVSVVVPTRNEARNIQVMLPAIAAVRPAVHEVIVVDGNSVDGTIETARRVLPWVRIVEQTRKGKGNAMACGFAAATGDIIVMFDADGSADPAEIPAFVAALKDGADFAKGTRFARGGGSDDITLLRRAGNAGLNGVANALFATRHSDLCYGYNAFWSDLLPLLELPAVDAPAPVDGSMLWGDGFEIETVLACRVAAAELAVTEVPSYERERMFGDTNLRTFADGTRVLRTLAAERRRANTRKAGQPAAAADSVAAQAAAEIPVGAASVFTPSDTLPVPPTTGPFAQVSVNGLGGYPSSNGHTNGHADGTNGHSNGHGTNGHNGYSNGHTNGNGHNGHGTNGHNGHDVGEHNGHGRPMPAMPPVPATVPAGAVHAEAAMNGTPRHGSANGAAHASSNGAAHSVANGVATGAANGAAHAANGSLTAPADGAANGSGQPRPAPRPTPRPAERPAYRRPAPRGALEARYALEEEAS